MSRIYNVRLQIKRMWYLTTRLPNPTNENSWHIRRLENSGDRALEDQRKKQQLLRRNDGDCNQ